MSALANLLREFTRGRRRGGGMLGSGKLVLSSGPGTKLRHEWLEERRLLAADLWVNDDWMITTDNGPLGLSAGDIVASNPGETAVAGLIFGTDAFSTIPAALAAPTTGDTIHVLKGVYSGSVAVNENVSIIGQSAADVTLNVSAIGVSGVSISAGNTASLSGVTLNHTGAAGTGIDVKGSLTLSDSSVVMGPSGLIGINVDGSAGGGSLTMTSTIVSGATVFGVNVGGGATANVAIDHSEIGVASGAAAAISASSGSASVATSKLTTASASSKGVLVTSSGSVSISGSDLSGIAVGGKAVSNARGGGYVADASGNWWGATSESAVLALTEGAVDVTPYLASGADGDLGAAGFVGDFSHLYVTAVGDQTGLSGRVTEGVDALADGALVGGVRLVDVNAGTYIGSVLINNAVTLRGGNAGVAGTGSRSAESVLQESAASGALVEVNSADVTIDGLTIDGSDLAFRGIRANEVSDVVIQNNIIAAAVRALQFNGQALTGNTGGVVAQNLIHDLTTGSESYGVLAFDASYVSVTDNSIAADVGMFEQYFYLPNGVSNSPNIISGNTITASLLGYGTNERSANAATTALSNNDYTITGGLGSIGVQLFNIYKTDGVTLTDEMIAGADVGVYAFISGGSATISGGTIDGGGTYGVQVTNYLADFTYAATGDGSVTIDGAAIQNYETGVFVEDHALGAFQVAATIQNDVEITATTTGVLVSGVDASALIVNNDNLIHGNQIGVDVDGGQATIDGNHIYDNHIGVRFANGGSGSLVNNDFNGVNDNLTDVQLSLDAGAVSIDAANLFGGDDYFIDNQGAQNIDLTTYGATNFEGLTDNFRIEDKIHHRVDTDLPASTGLVTWVADNVYVTTPGVGSTDSSIQRGIDAASPGDTVNVEAGTYLEDVLINKAGLHVLGAGSGATTISGVIGGDSATVRVGASNVEVAGFEITREGNTTLEWNNPGLNSAGVAVQGVTIAGLNLHDNLITHNRTGVDINNSNGHTIRNNEIVENRTGLIFRNQTDNLLVAENAISDNTTVGIVFLDASSGSNFPVQQALGSSFTNNDLSGNWYGAVVDRQTGGSLPAAGANIKDFSGNYWGTTSLVVTTANSAEPGYPAQVPSWGGGTATAPGGRPDIAGAASANVDYTAYLNLGTDVDGFTFGFQGDFSDLTVTAAGAQTGLVGRIQEGVDLATTTATVHVLGGSYLGDVSTVGKAITLSAGASPAQVIMTGSLTLDSDDVVPIELDGLLAANQFDNFVVTGTVELGGAVLQASRGFNPFPGDSFKIIDNDGPLAVTGTFAGLSEGSDITLAGIPFTISYVGGDGNDVVLTAAQPTEVWVNDTWVETSNDSGGVASVVEVGDTVESDGGSGDATVSGKVFGYNAFSSVQDAVNAILASPTSTLHVLTGVYDEAVVVNKNGLTISLLGTAGSAVLTRTSGALGHALMNVQASGATLDGLKYAVVQPYSVAAVYMGSTAGAPYDDLTVKNSVFTISGSATAGAADAYIGFGTTSTAISVRGQGTYPNNPTATIINNQILPTLDMSGDATAIFDRAVFLREANGIVQGNVIYGDSHDLVAQFVGGGTVMSPAALTVDGNQFLGKGGKDTKGAQVDFTEPDAHGQIVVTNNTFTPFAGATPSGSVHVRSLMLKNNNSGANVVIDNNAFTAVSEVGVLLAHAEDVTLTNNSFNAATGDSDFVYVQVTNKVPTGGAIAANELNATIQGNIFHEGAAGGGRALEFLNHNSVGATVGSIVIGGAGSLANTFEDGLSSYLYLDASSGSSLASSRPYYGAYGATTMAPWSFDLDASQNTFGPAGSELLPSAMNLSELFAVEDRIVHGPDDAALGVVTVVPNNLYVTTPGTGITNESIQSAVNAATSGDTIHVQEGTYVENVTINKGLTLLGANSGVTGAGVRGAESIIQADAATIAGATVPGAVVTVSASDVTIDGFTVTGDDPLATGLNVYSGVDANALYGITNGNTAGGFAIDGMVVRNNIVKQTAIGVFGNGAAGASTTSVIDQNLLEDIGVFDFGWGVALRNNFYADITDNVMRRVYSGVIVNNYSVAKGSAWLLAGNDIESFGGGLWHNQSYSAATPLEIIGNQLTESTGAPAVANNIGLLFTLGPGGVSPVVTGNTIDDHDYGVVVWNSPTGVTLGAGNAITDAEVGALVTNNVGFNPFTTTLLGLTANGSLLTIDGASIAVSPGGTGVSVAGGAGGGVATIGLQNGSAISDGTVGLLIDGSQTSVSGNSLADTEFTGQADYYVSLTGTALDNQEVDASLALFDSVVGGAGTLPQAFAIEDKLRHAPDDAGVGLVRIQAGQVFVTTPATGASDETIQRGIDAANAGDTVHVQVGVYNESPTINKSLTLIGEDRDTTTIALLPTTTPGTNYLAPLLINAPLATVDVSGFTIAGNAGTAASLANSNVYVESGAASVALHDNRFKVGSYDPGATTGDDGIGIVTAYTETTSQFIGSLTVVNNEFVPAVGTSLNGRPFAINTGVTSFVFDNNQIIGDFSDSALTSASAGVIKNNTVTGNASTPAGSRVGGFTAFGYPTNSFGVTEFDNNVIQYVRNAIRSYGAVIDVHDNAVTNSDRAIVAQAGGTFTAADNDLDAVAASDDNLTDFYLSSDAAAVTFGTGNSLGGQDYFIENLSPVDYDLTAYGAAEFEGLDSGTLADAFAIEDFLYHKVDVGNSAAGLLRIVAGNLYVTTPSSGASDETIQLAVDAASTGDVVNVQSGTYEESVTVPKGVTIDGEGSGPTPLATITAAAPGTTLVNVTSPAATDNVTIRDIAFAGVNGPITASFGVNVPATANFDTLTIERSSFEGLTFNGVQILGNSVTGDSVDNVVIDSSTFVNNGSNTGGAGDIDFFTYNNDATLSNLILSNNGAAEARLGIQFRGTGDGAGNGDQPIGNVSLSNVDVSGKYRTQMVGFQRYSDVNDLTFSGVKLGGATSEITGGFGASLRFDAVGDGSVTAPATFDLGDTTFRGLAGTSAQRHEIEIAPDNTHTFLRMDGGDSVWTIGGTDYVAGTLNPTAAPDLVKLFAIEDRILHYVDKINPPNNASYKGFVEILAGDAFIGYDDDSGNPSGVVGNGSIQRGVNIVPTSGTVYVEDGTFTENVDISKNVSLLSQTDRNQTTLQGVSGVGALGSIVVSGTTSDVNIGGLAGHGFTIIGIDNGIAGVENAAVYIKGTHSGTDIRSNEVVAQGDHGLLAEFGATMSGTVVDDNIFSGQTFLGPNPAGDGFGTQFSLANVPRQLVVIANVANKSNVAFTNNQLVGTAGGLSLTDNAGGATAPQEQGNTLATIDVAVATISGNDFSGTTSRFAQALRARGTSNTIVGNLFNGSMGAQTVDLYVNNLGNVIQGNTFASSAGAAIQVDGSGFAVIGGTGVGEPNSITGYPVGVVVGGSVAPASADVIANMLVDNDVAILDASVGGAVNVENNFFVNNSTGVAAVASATGSLVVDDNSFTDASPLNGMPLTQTGSPSLVGISNASSISVAASNNWWGSVYGPTSTLNPSAGSPKGVQANNTGTGALSIAPWISDNGDDTDLILEGFQHNLLDVTPPPAPASPDLQATSDSGSSNTDDVTNDDTPTFDVSYVGEQPVTLQLLINGLVVDSVLISSNGTYSFTSAPLADGTYNVSSRAVDLAGNVGLESAALSVSIDTVAPAVNAGPDLSVNEGDLVSITGSFSNAGGGPGAIVRSWDAAIGFNAQSVPGVPSDTVSFTPNDNGSITLTYRAVDLAGNTGTDQAVVSAANVIPSPSAISLLSASINENGFATGSLTTTDPGSADLFSVQVDWEDGVPDVLSLGLADAAGTVGGTIYAWTAATRSLEVSHQYLDDDPMVTPSDNYVLAIKVADDDMSGNFAGTAGIDFVEATTNLTVNNVAPTAVTYSLPASVDEGSSATITITGQSDVGSLDTFTYSYVVKKNGLPFATSGGFVASSSFMFIPDDMDPGIIWTVEVQAQDDDGGLSPVAIQPLTVVDVAPTVQITSLSTPIDENALATLVFRLVDPGAGDLASTGQVSVNWGDGSSPTVINSGLDLASLQAGGTVSRTHTYLDDDPSNTSSDVKTITFNAVQLSPTLIYSNLGLDGASLPRTVTVNNLAPTGIFLTSTPTISAGDSVSVNWIAQNDASPSDVSAGLRYTYFIDADLGNDFDPGEEILPTSTYGTGTYGGSVISDSVVIPGSYFATPGTVRVGSMILDDDLGVTTQFVDIDVQPTTFRVVSLTPTDTGFVVTFNRPADTAPVNLYAGRLAAGGTSTDGPDVTLTGSGGVGNVRGSIVWNAARTSFEFIKTGDILSLTGGVLAPANYTVTLESGDTAFQDQVAGEDLDGDNNNVAGGNFSGAFSVAANSARIVSIPDFARGSSSTTGQAITVPFDNNLAAGIPILLSNGLNVSAVDLDVVYDPALIDITSVAVGADTGTWTVTSNLTTPGHATITIFSATGFGASSGLKEIARLVAKVDDGAAYGSSEILRIENLAVYELGNPVAVASKADSALHKAIFVGDANASGFYSGLDASWISEVRVGLFSGFGEYPVTDPVIIADVTGSRTIDGLDSSWVSQKGLAPGLRPEIPNIPTGGLPVMAGIDPTIAIPLDVLGSPGHVVHVPLQITDSALGLTGFNATVDYDTALLDLPSGLNAGGIAIAGMFATETGWTLDTYVDDAAGSIALSFYRTGNSVSTAGQIADLAFTVSPLAPSGTTPLVVGGPTEDPPFSFTHVDGSILIDAVGPKVAEILVDSSTWSHDFRDLLDGGLDDGNTADNGIDDGALDRARGYLFPGGSGQLATLPWTNIDAIKIVFTEDVIGSIDASDFSIVAAPGFLSLDGGANLGVVPSFMFSYVQATRTATLSLSTPLNATAIDLKIASAGIQDDAGNLLDGEWTDGGSSFPSGLGGPGGDFSFRMLSLPGDVRDDHGTTGQWLVDAFDGQDERDSQGGFVVLGLPPFLYDPRADINGDGVILADDATIVRDEQGAFLFESPPMMAAISGVDSISASLEAEIQQSTGISESLGQSALLGLSTYNSSANQTNEPIERLVRPSSKDAAFSEFDLRRSRKDIVEAGLHTEQEANPPFTPQVASANRVDDAFGALAEQSIGRRRLKHSLPRRFAS